MRRYCETFCSSLLQKRRKYQEDLGQKEKNYLEMKGAWFCINRCAIPQDWKVYGPLAECHSDAVCMMHKSRHHIVVRYNHGLDG